MSNTISVASLDWSLAHHAQFGDTDLFPRLFEFDVIADHWKKVRTHLRKLDLQSHAWSPPRRVLVPKDPLIFRSGSQFDPIDSLLFAALIRECGELIERRRISVAHSKVFSSRFNPDESGQLYSTGDHWGEFWKKSLHESSRPTCTHVVICDIADFYQQIGHAGIQTQLELANVPVWCSAAIAALLRVSAGDVGRGLPVGPHASHLLAELSLIPLDNMLTDSYPNFCRFVDDIHVFCKSEAEAELALYDLANVLDGTLHLWTSGRKTRLIEADEFREMAKANDRGDLSDEEERILRIVQQATGSPYTFASFDKLDEDDKKAFDRSIISDVLGDYLEAPEPDYAKLRWFLRRLA